MTDSYAITDVHPWRAQIIAQSAWIVAEFMYGTEYINSRLFKRVVSLYRGDTRMIVVPSAKLRREAMEREMPPEQAKILANVASSNLAIMVRTVKFALVADDIRPALTPTMWVNYIWVDDTSLSPLALAPSNMYKSVMAQVHLGTPQYLKLSQQDCTKQKCMLIGNIETNVGHVVLDVDGNMDKVGTVSKFNFNIAELRTHINVMIYRAIH